MDVTDEYLVVFRLFSYGILGVLRLQSRHTQTIVPAPENIVQDKPVAIYTTTPTHASHIIIQFYIQRHLRTILILFENMFYQVGSFFPWLNQKKIDSNINNNFLCPCTRWTCYISSKGIYYFYSLLVILKSYWTFSSLLTYSKHCKIFVWLNR